MNATITKSGNTLSIYINEILHLRVTDRVTAIHSWKEENNWWKIEIQTKDNTILLEYDTREKWVTILKLLDTI